MSDRVLPGPRHVPVVAAMHDEPPRAHRLQFGERGGDPVDVGKRLVPDAVRQARPLQRRDHAAFDCLHVGGLHIDRDAPDARFLVDLE